MRACNCARASPFQSTHPRGVRRWTPVIFVPLAMFQSTHPRGVRHQATRPPGIDKYLFQSTHPRGVRRGAWEARKDRKQGFNPRTRVGCDLVAWWPGGLICLRFQSTHPRGVRREAVLEGAALSWLFQSTHPRGVRPACTLLGSSVRTVSIHAPAWGATLRSIVRFTIFRVSIHAPAWGATGLHVVRLIRENGFNPRTRVGCDPNIFFGLFQNILFQSTHPRGVRRCWTDIIVQPCACFNPRTRVGCD